MMAKWEQETGFPAKELAVFRNATACKKIYIYLVKAHNWRADLE